MFVKKRISWIKKPAILLLVFLFLGIGADRAWASEDAVIDNTTITAEAVSNTADTLSTDAKTEESNTTAITSDSDFVESVVAQNSSDVQSDAANSDYPVSPFDEVKKPVDDKLRVEADSVTGGFVYTYPLATPPGRNGIQPDLKLIYNNQNENIASVFGYGWSVNIPYIERVNKKGVETLFSQYYFNSSLTGELMRVGTSTSYGSRVDNGEFLKYELFDDIYWQVTDKKGVKYIFGLSAAARQDNPASSTQIFKWMLEKVVDPNNNYISYNYYKDNGQIYLDTIKYAGFNTTDGIFEVNFIRESRDDAMNMVNTGFNVKSNYRISHILIKMNGTSIRQYQMAYQSGDNGYKLLLHSIIESGQDETGNTVVLPSNTFNYQEKAKNWIATSSSPLPVSVLCQNYGDAGVRFVDVNGDGLIDVVKAIMDDNTCDPSRGIYINKGDGTGWVNDPDWVIPEPVIFRSLWDDDSGDRLADVNGDGLPDIFGTHGVYINKGETLGWQRDFNWAQPFAIRDSKGRDGGVRFADINGDGLLDAVAAIFYTDINGGGHTVKAVYINKGDGIGWVYDSNWIVPSLMLFISIPAYNNCSAFDAGSRLVDVNGDGLADIIGDGIFINKGDGTGWSLDSNWNFPTPIIESGVDAGTRLEDVNGDGLVDVVKAVLRNNGAPTKGVFINKGDGTGWIYDPEWNIPEAVFFNDIWVPNSFYSGVTMVDINGDGLADILGANVFGSNGVYLAAPKKADSLSLITTNKGAKASVIYKNTSEYLSATSTLLNPKLQINLQTAYQIGVDDGQGNVATSTYSYADGAYYYNNAYDKKFAGFGSIIKTNPEGNATKDYYHQGNVNSTSTGEYADHISKSGKAYRTEVYDNSGNLYSKAINKWDRADLGDGRNFVKLGQSVDFTYNGSATHADKAKSFAYNDTNGNKTQEIDWGQVSGSDDGTFSDSGTDMASTSISYAASSTGYIVGLPSQQSVYDQSANKIRESKYYYDNLAFGNMNKGNMTKQEDWKEGSTYISTQKTYNNYGLVTQDKDARGKNTNYVYDQYNLYIATSTNPLSQSTQYYYDYSNGKPKKVVDPNYRVFETVFDGLDRVVRESQPDIANPAATTTKVAYQYTDSSFPRCIKKTSYLDNVISTDAYTYLDGLDRAIQQRNQAEDADTFSAKDSIYNKNGLLFKESLPYFSNGTSKTSATATGYLYSSYIYDPLNRIKAAANAVGTTTYAYSEWQTTVTDPLSHTKSLHKDARNNLVRVDERNGSSNDYSTYYQYDPAGKLTKITDALSNLRNFVYDGLGRLLKSEDLHVATDTTYGSTTLAYDDAGNLTTKITPNSQTINYSYDDINRPLTEDYTGQGGTEVVYGYDSCENGKGRLCSATTSAAVANYAYNALGLVKTESKKIGTATFMSSNDYDRQGNPTSLIYPDGGTVKYDYNNAGLLEKISKKESGESSYVDIVSDYDYSPLGQVSYSLTGNGSQTYNYYEPTELYRLKNIFTILPGYDGSGIRTMKSAAVNSLSVPAPASDAARAFNNAMSDLVATKKAASATVVSAAEAAAYAQVNGTFGQAKSLSSEYMSSNLLSNSAPHKPTNLLTEGLWLTETITDNDGFESGLSGWSTYSSGDNTISADCNNSYTGSCSAKINVASSTANWWDPFILQQIRLDAGINYTLKFKAKAATSTSAQISVSQNHDPYYGLGLQKYFNLGTSWKSYSYSFTSSATDLAARIMFGFGEHTADYWLDDVQIVPDGLNQMKNSSFEDDFYNGWNFWSYGGTASSTNAITCLTSAAGDCSDYTHIQSAGQSWQVQLHQPMAATSTNTYVLTFYAKASSSRVIHPVIVMNHDPWSDLTSWESVAITPTWTKYSLELTPLVTDSNARLMFYLGDYAPGVYIDDVHLWVKQDIKLTTAIPDFSGIFADIDAGDTSSYYQIQLREKHGSFSSPLWDSGKTAMSTTAVNSRTPDINYSGPAISTGNGKAYYWRLKLWDNSDAEGPWTNGRDYFQMYGDAVQDIDYYYDAVGNIIQIKDESYTNAAKTVDYTYDTLYRLTRASSTVAENGQNYIQTYVYNAIGNITNKSDIGDYAYSGYVGSSYANPHAATAI